MIKLLLAGADATAMPSALLTRGPGHVRTLLSGLEAWLTEKERAAFARFTVPKRRADWLLGRWAAKRAFVLSGEAAREEEVSVLATPSGAPEAFVGWRPSPLALSLTHSHGVAVAALGPPGARVGIDLEKIEERPVSFLGDWFTGAEQVFALSAAPPALGATLVWSAKEAVMKALREGLRIPPKSVEVAPEAGPSDGAWRPFAARGPGEAAWTGWWRELDGFVLSGVADPPSGPPERIG